MMAVHVPFDIQTIIIKKLPAKSLIRFRCVSKHWKSLIDSSEFIKNYQPMNDRHLLVRYMVRIDTDEKLSITDEYISIIDNDAFPQHMSPKTVPLSIKTLQHLRILGSSHGIICFHGFHKDYPDIDSEMVVFWNPSIRKSVSVLLEPPVRLRTSWVGFGVCPETRDPKLVKIDDIRGVPEFQVYTLSTRAWKNISLKPPYEPCALSWFHKLGVCVEGFIYWLARDDRLPPLGNGSNSIVSFDLSNNEFGKVYLPYSLQRSEHLVLSKWNKCLTLCDYHTYDNLFHWDVWMMKDNGVTRSSTMMFRIDSIFEVYNVLGFRKNGEAIIERGYANFYDADRVDPILQVYDPFSGRVNDIRIPFLGHDDIFDIRNTTLLSVSSYMETLLLLDQ